MVQSLNQDGVKPVTQQLETVQITHGPVRRRLQTPVEVTVPAAQSPIEEAVQRYIIKSLSEEQPRLIPFALHNQTVKEMARQLQRYASGSTGTLYLYTRCLHRYCSWINRTPDQLIAECRDPEGDPDPKAQARHVRQLEEFIDCLQGEGLAPQTILNHVKGVKALYRTNGLSLELPQRLPSRLVSKGRTPTSDDLQRLVDLADLRGKVVVSMLALGGFREGTLCRLRYYHVREDLEAGVVPIHIHVEAEITKGKYHDYDTFLGREAVDYLKAYLDLRRHGSASGHIPPETMTDESPLIRDACSRKPRPISPVQVYKTIHDLFYRAGMLGPKKGRLYSVRPHSLRKYFRTQLTALGVPVDYIEYMMGHTISTYHDMEMKGIDFLRNIYAASGLSIRPRTQLGKMEALKEIIRAWGMNPEQILTREALSQPHRAHADPTSTEEDHLKALSNALRDMMRKELLDSRNISQ